MLGLAWAWSGCRDRHRFINKTETTPTGEIDLAVQRAKQVKP